MILLKIIGFNLLSFILLLVPISIFVFIKAKRFLARRMVNSSWSSIVYWSLIVTVSVSPLLFVVVMMGISWLIQMYLDSRN